MAFWASLPAVSKRLSQLEQRLGVQLLQRTTRRLALTPEGVLYLEGGRPILRQLDELESALGTRQPTLHGRLRINATLGEVLGMGTPVYKQHVVSALDSSLDTTFGVGFGEGFVGDR